jgi:transcriptional regulator with GAF, ATPase, and Fis domain
METLIERAPPAPPLDEASLASVLAEIADAAAETLELQDVFDRVATAIRRLIPLDHMGVVRILDGQWAVLHATTVPCPEGPAVAREQGGLASWRECTPATPLDDWSPRVRPWPGPLPRVADAALELDPAFPHDRKLIDKGVRSTMWEPFRMGESFGGGVWACSFTPYAFTAEHQQVLRPIAAVLGSAVEHWRIWDAERRRRLRLDQLESLLGTLAESLDVRAVFARLSQAVQALLPHHLMALTQLDLRGRTIRVVAGAGDHGIEQPGEPVALTDEETSRRAQDFELMRDLPSELAGSTERERLILSTGMRSWLRVPVLLGDEVAGGLSFFHREPAQYRRDDAELAARLADRVALMLSHQRLAEEARVAAEARERAERLEATVESLALELRSRGYGRVVGASPSWRQVLQQVGRVAGAETTVLVTGESGTGKEVVAHLLHEGSARAKRPLVAVNCAALPEQLLESELFGHEKGAFTGAFTSKIGRLEQAAGGTLFLDEIAEMSPLLQAKLLRVLQEREFQRLGGTRTLKADVRVLAATNRDLAAAIERGDFREDLYYRLNVFEIHVPALRERPDDVLPLAELFLEELGRTMGRPAAGISREAREWLLAYRWPGNVRELRNAIERAILLCDGGLITSEHLPTGVTRAEASRPVAASGNAGGNGALPAGGVDLEAVERRYVQQALEQARGNKSRAARLLGLTRAQLYSRLDKYGLKS